LAPDPQTGRGDCAKDAPRRAKPGIIGTDPQAGHCRTSAACSDFALRRAKPKGKEVKNECCGFGSADGHTGWPALRRAGPGEDDMQCRGAGTQSRKASAPAPVAVQGERVNVCDTVAEVDPLSALRVEGSLGVQLTLRMCEWRSGSDAQLLRTHRKPTSVIRQAWVWQSAVLGPAQFRSWMSPQGVGLMLIRAPCRGCLSGCTID